MYLTLKFDLRAPSFGAPVADLYAAALAQCSWADSVGFSAVRFLEHHGSDDRYCPSPLIMAAAVAAMTTRVRIRARALILPLHDPVRIAEDSAVIDLISRGRLELVVAGGYVRSEFEMFGHSLSERAQLMEDGIRALKDAWTGEPFTYRGRPAIVALRPFQRPHPPLVMGGSSLAAARRAARLCDGFEPNRPELFGEYVDECRRLGTEPGPPMPPTPAGTFLCVADDPDSAWREMGAHLVHESRAYGQLLSDAGMGSQYQVVTDAAELRATGNYLILTPAECIAMARELGREGQLEFHPLIGGVSPELGWQGLQLFADKVLPALRAGGLVDAEL